MQDCAQYVEYIAQEPDYYEGEGEPVSGGAAEIFNYLGREDDDPAGDGDGAADATNGIEIEGGDRSHCCRVCDDVLKCDEGIKRDSGLRRSMWGVGKFRQKIRLSDANLVKIRGIMKIQV